VKPKETPIAGLEDAMIRLRNYGEDECADYVAASIAEFSYYRELEKRLPHTKDGAVITNGMPVWFENINGEIVGGDSKLVFVIRWEPDIEDQEFETWAFSTQAAAEAARGQG